MVSAGLACAFGAPAYAEEQPSVLDVVAVAAVRPQTVDNSTLKMDAPLLETARSVSVIDATRIREQDFQSGADLLSWVPGVNANGESYHFYARGFRMAATDWKIDGFSGRVINGSYSPNLFGFESVSVLKGPASLLYGATSAPGGQISLVSKMPREKFSATIDTRVRTFAGGEVGFAEDAGWEAELDVTGPATPDKRVLYRVLSSVEHSLSRPAAGDDNQFHRASVTVRLDKEGRFEVTPVVEWSREDRAARGASISPSSSRTTADGRTEYTLSDATPRDVNLAWGARVDENLTWGADGTAKFTEDWTARLSARHHTRDYEGDTWNLVNSTLTQANPADPKSWTIRRQHTRARSEFETFSLDGNTSVGFEPLRDLEATVLAGWNARWQDAQAYTSGTGSVQSPINTFTGVASTPLVADAGAPTLGLLTETFAWNGYLQGQARYADRLILTASGGLTGDEVGTTSASGVESATVYRSSSVTPNLGVVYLLTPKVAAYASFSTSYNLPSATAEDVNGDTGTFDPIEGESYEAGLKAEFCDKLLAASLSVFNTELNSVLVLSDVGDLNANGNQYYRQLDTGRTSQGVEFEATLTALPHWDTTVTYAWIDAHNRNNDGSRAGRAEMTPRHATSLFSRYTFASGPLAGLSARLGVLWQGERIGGSSAPTAAAPDPLVLESFYRVDVGLAYAWRAWTFAVNVENVTDENYLLGGATGLALERANPRTISLRTSRRW